LAEGEDQQRDDKAPDSVPKPPAKKKEPAPAPPNDGNQAASANEKSDWAPTASDLPPAVTEDPATTDADGGLEESMVAAEKAKAEAEATSESEKGPDDELKPDETGWDEPLTSDISRVRVKPTPEFLNEAAPMNERLSERRWWQPPPDMPFSPEPSGHLTRNLAYEIMVSATSFLAAVVAWFLTTGGEFQDVYVFYHRDAPVSDQVSVVTVGEEALYLWDPANPEPDVTPRDLLGEIVSFLDAAGARVVVLDFLLEEPAPGDNVLASAAANHGGVIGAEHWRLTDPNSGRFFVPGIVKSFDDAIQPAFANMEEQPASLFARELLVRRTGLVHRVSRVRVDGVWPMNMTGNYVYDNDAALMPGLGLAAAWLHTARGANPDATLADLDTLLRDNCDGYPLNCDLDANDLGLPWLPVNVDTPMDINFRGPEGGDRLPTIRASQIIRALGMSRIMDQTLAKMSADAGLPVPDPTPIIVPDDMVAQFKDRVVVVGRVTGVGRAGADRFATPYSFPMYLNADMAGVRLHANVVDTLLTGRHIRSVPWPLPWLLALVGAAACFVTRKHLRDGVHAAVWIATTGLLVYVGMALFRATDGLVFDMGIPIGFILLATFFQHVRGWAIEDSLDATVFDED